MIAVVPPGAFDETPDPPGSTGHQRCQIAASSSTFPPLPLDFFNSIDVDRVEKLGDLLPVDFPAMTDGLHGHFFGIHGVDHPIVAYSQPIEVAASAHFQAADRVWGFRQGANGFIQTRTDVLGKGTSLPCGGGIQIDGVGQSASFT